MKHFRKIGILAGFALGAAAVTGWLGAVRPVHAQLGVPTLPSWFGPVWTQSRSAPVRPSQPGETPAMIPVFAEQRDPSGKIATYQPKGATFTAANAYFAAMGSNGRTCFTCHQPQSAWALDPASARFALGLSAQDKQDLANFLNSL